jgi:hypothetical protein
MGEIAAMRKSQGWVTGYAMGDYQGSRAQGLSRQPTLMAW